MCGISGIIETNKVAKIDKKYHIGLVNKTMHHRGPDSKGCWTDSKDKVGFGHCRLSIIDLSDSANQPMISENGRFVITFNGEIYNFEKLKDDLSEYLNVKDINSDTKILLEYISVFGINKTLQRIEGMYAFGVWDKIDRNLFLINDRAGVKPIYWCYLDNIFFFASELSGFKKIFNNLQIDSDSLTNYLRHGYIPAPWTIFKNVKKFQPATLLSFSCTNQITTKQYWDFDEKKDQYEYSEKKIIDSTEDILKQAVSNCMVSDVRVASFLSGGIDSTLITALMNQFSTNKVKTFTIGFQDKNYDESIYSKKISKHLQTDHNEMIISSKDLLNVIPKISEIYSEPFADSSQIPTFILSQYTSNSVKVALSGDGGDELFGGYNRYRYANNFYKTGYRLPKNIKFLIKKILKFIASKNYAIFKNKKFTFGIPELNNKIEKISNLLDANSRSEIYRILTSYTTTPDIFVKDANEKSTLFNCSQSLLEKHSFERYMQILDFKTYLPDDILAKVDRASMNVSLETRVPFLEKIVLEHVKKINPKYTVNNANQKLILKNILKKYLPEKLFIRPKKGFSIPLNDWLNNDLKDLVTTTLNQIKLKNQGILDHKNINNLISNKTITNYYLVWNLIIFQIWYDDFLKK